jgi:two-component system response regulator AtoC
MIATLDTPNVTPRSPSTDSPAKRTEGGVSSGSHADGTAALRYSPQMRAVWSMAKEVARTNATGLLRGESGVGTDVVARAIHAASDQSGGPYDKVNCAALPSDLLESELFGHEKGAFTGAYRRKPGHFEYANGGTIYLDEIGELPHPLQAKLLHVLQDLRFARIGGHAAVEVDARVITATNRDLEVAMGRGEFREDLYYRLNVVELNIPPLRERKEEIPALSAWLLARLNAQYGREVTLSPDTLASFMRYSWPGNVRELDNVLRRLVVLGNPQQLLPELGHRSQTASARQLTASGTPESLHRSPADDEASLGLKEIARRAARESERRALIEVLERVRWNRTEAAAVLKVSYKTILNKIAELELSPGRTRRGVDASA